MLNIKEFILTIKFRNYEEFDKLALAGYIYHPHKHKRFKY